MVRVRRWVAAAVLGGTCLGPVACNPFSPSSQPDGGGKEPGPAPEPVVADIGAPPYKAAEMPKLPPPEVRPDPIVIHPAVVQYDLKVQIPAQVDALIELIATPVNGPVDPNDPLIVYHPRDTERKQAFRRLRENDVVKVNQTLVRLDEQMVATQITSSEKIIKVSEEAIAAGQVAYDKYKQSGDLTENLFKRQIATIMEVLNAQATVARLQENMLQSMQAKVKAEGELIQAQTKLVQYWCRSPVNGRITKILKSPGEFAKAGETILEIQSTDRVRVEGKLPAEYASLIKKDTPAVIEPMVPLGPLPFADWHRQEVTSVAVTAHPGRPMIVSGGLDATVSVWDVTQTKVAHLLPHPAGVAVRSVACTGPTSKVGHWVATGADDGKVRLWDVSNPDKMPKEPNAVLEDSHAGGVVSTAFSPDGKLLATGAGREVFLWNTADKKKLYTLPHEHKDAITALRFTPQATLVTVSRDRTIRVWKLGENGAAPAEPMIDHRSGAVDVLGVSADGSRVLFDKDAGRIDVLGLADGRTVGSVVNPAANARFTGLAIFSPDEASRFILTAGGDGDVKGELQLWDAPKVGGRASERRRLVTPGRAAVTCAAFSTDKDNQFVVVGTQYGGVHYWTPPSEQPRQWVGRVESVLPADARSVQVRVVMDNPADVGTDALQDRSTATILLDPAGQIVVAPKTGTAVAPAPRLEGGVRQAGGRGDDGKVVRAEATFPVEPGLPAIPTTSPVRTTPLPNAPLAHPPTVTLPPAKATGSLPGAVLPPVPERK